MNQEAQEIAIKMASEVEKAQDRLIQAHKTICDREGENEFTETIERMISTGMTMLMLLAAIFEGSEPASDEAFADFQEFVNISNNVWRVVMQSK